MAMLTVVRCAAHTIQLVVHDVLKTTAKNPIAKIRNVARNVRSTRYLNYTQKRIVLRLDNATRWNSLYTLFESMLKERRSFEILIEALEKQPGKESDLADVFLDDGHFMLMENFVEAFKPIYTCTTLLQTQEMAMSKHNETVLRRILR